MVLAHRGLGFHLWEGSDIYISVRAALSSLVREAERMAELWPIIRSISELCLSPAFQCPWVSHPGSTLPGLETLLSCF